MPSTVKLCAFLQGVQFTIVDEGSPVRAVILKEALEARFGASDLPAEWVGCYQENRRVIDHAALLIHQLRPVLPVVVLRGDEPELVMHFPSARM